MILRSLSVVFLLNIFDYLLGPVSTVLVTKTLSVSDNGAFNWVGGTLVGMVTTFFALGLSQYNFREIPGREPGLQYRIFGRSLFIQVVACLLGGVVVAFVVRDDLIRYGIWGLFLARIFFYLVNNELIRFLGLQKKNILKSVMSVLDSRLWFIPLTVLFAFQTLSVGTAFAAMVGSNVVTLLILLVVARPRPIVANFVPDPQFTSEALKFSLPLVLVDLGMYLQDTVSRLVLKQFVTDSDFGLYTNSTSWFMLVFRFGMLVVYTTQPYFSESFARWKAGHEGAFERFGTQIKIVFRYTLILIGTMGICFVFNYGDLIVLLGKEEYRQTIQLSWFLLPLPLAMFLAYFNQILVVLNGETKLLPVFYGIAIAINVVIGVCFVPLWGYVAAGLAGTVSYFALAALLFSRTRDSIFRLRLTGREVILISLYFAVLAAINLCLSLNVHDLWIRVVTLAMVVPVLLLFVVRKEDLHLARSF